MRRRITLKGFTILEATVAIAVSAAVFIAVYSLSTVSLGVVNTQEDQVLASRIAREGIEYAVNKRDNNLRCILTGGCPISDWQDNLVGRWQVDVTEPNRLKPQAALRVFDSSKYLCIAHGGQYKGSFAYCNNHPDRKLAADFTREIYVARLDSNKLRAKSIVKWNTKFGLRRTLTVETILFGSNI